jgi:peptide chain release factor 1
MQEKLKDIEERYKELEDQMADPEIAADYSRVQALAKEHASLKNLAVLTARARQVAADIKDTRAISHDETDREMASLAREELAELEEEKIRIEEELKAELVQKDPLDDKNIVMEIRAGTGGDEAGLFAGDLYRMYMKYAQNKKWGLEIVHSNESGVGSIKEIVFQIKGEGAYSRLKHESGVHRVQRIPATESSGRIHTSAATVAVLPEAEEVDVQMDAEDVQIDVFHAGGHGGQNVQKVATAIRITHIPTGLMAICQDERSQLKNKNKAMAVLRSRVLAAKIEKQNKERTDARRSQVGSGDRSERVRTYNFPQSRVTDHRVGYTSHNLDLVMEGDIEGFIDALVEMEQAQRLEEAGV